MELVETFLVIFQASVSGLSRSDKEELAVHIIPEVNVVIDHAKHPRSARGNFTPILKITRDELPME